MAYYHIADLFLCMSAHEGFCIPLVEAMHFHIPIIAHASTAVPGTLAGSGVLVYSRDPEIVAETMNAVIENHAYRQEILTGQEARKQQLMPEVLEGQYLKALENILCGLDAKTDKESFHERKEDAYQFSLVHNLFAQMDKFSKYNGKFVVYGAGTVGMKLYKVLKKDGPEKELLLCDSYKAGNYDAEAGCRIISPEEAVKLAKEGTFIISVQDKKVMLEMAAFLLGHGIKKEQIALYDRLNNQIL
ncbi:MAG TPA: hypothetical protein DF613_07755 [Lachnospiraceae bacterium]|nr:hypothetical protein [Lachnospiraceae bacterium]